MAKPSRLENNILSGRGRKIITLFVDRTPPECPIGKIYDTAGGADAHWGEGPIDKYHYLMCSVPKHYFRSDVSGPFGRVRVILKTILLAQQGRARTGTRARAGCTHAFAIGA